MVVCLVYVTFFSSRYVCLSSGLPSITEQVWGTPSLSQQASSVDAVLVEDTDQDLLKHLVNNDKDSPCTPTVFLIQNA